MFMPTRKIETYTIHYTDADELLALKREIFTQHSYFFETKNAQPRIIDAGAHIGLATLYFKKLFPAAQITAIEPHPTAVKLFEQNIWENDCSDVTIIEAALAPPLTKRLKLHEDSEESWLSTTGQLEKAWSGQMQTRPLTSSVQTIDLASLIEEPVDLIKLDIEGMEQAVVMNLPAFILQKIGQFLIEFHPTKKQSLAQLVEFLEKRNFAVTLTQDGKKVFVQRATGLVMLHASNTSHSPTPQ